MKGDPVKRGRLSLSQTLKLIAETYSHDIYSRPQ